MAHGARAVQAQGTLAGVRGQSSHRAVSHSTVSHSAVSHSAQAGSSKLTFGISSLHPADRRPRPSHKREHSSGESSDESNLERNQQRRAARRSARESERVAAIDERAAAAHADAESQMRRILTRASPEAAQLFARPPQA
jgi:hypothetical protein